MAGLSFEDVSKKLQSLLETVDPNSTTTKDIFRLLTEDLGEDVKNHKRDIRDAVAKYFEEKEKKESTKRPLASDNEFCIQLSSSLFLSVAEKSGKKCIDLYSEGKGAGTEDRRKKMTFSKDEYLTLLDRMKQLESEGANDTQEFDLSSSEHITVKNMEGEIRVVLSEERATTDTDQTKKIKMKLDLDSHSRKIMDDERDAILGRFQEEERPSSSQTGKRQRVERTSDTSESSPSKPAMSIPGDHVLSLELDNKIFLSVSEFKGKLRADLRRHYMDKKSGELRPTQKGLSMDKQQFTTLIENIDALKEAATEQKTTFSVEIGRNRKASISDFTGRCLVDLREYYQPKTGGELKPGKKGISFDVKLLDILSQRAEEIAKAMN